MKRYTTMLLAMTLSGLLFLAACSAKVESNTTTTTTPTTENTESAAAPSDAQSLTGTYEMAGGDEQGELKVDESETGIKIHLYVSVGNGPEAEFTGGLVEDGEGGLMYDENGCILKLNFTADGCDITYGNPGAEACGVGDGAAAVEGHYAKTSSEKPQF